MHFDQLTAPEQRVLGCLIEKRWTTPDQYPLSINALRNACNQSTNRDPVVRYDEDTVFRAAQRLCEYGLARLASGHSSRATKYRHLAEEGLGLERGELALLCVLLLRGAQTPGELKQRTERMATFGSLQDVERGLGELAERGYARGIGRRPGQKEDRYVALLGGEPALDGSDLSGAHGGGAAGGEEPGGPSGAGVVSGAHPHPVSVAPQAPVTVPAPRPDPETERRLRALEDEVAALRARLDELIG